MDCGRVSKLCGFCGLRKSKSGEESSVCEGEATRLRSGVRSRLNPQTQNRAYVSPVFAFMFASEAFFA